MTTETDSHAVPAARIDALSRPPPRSVRYGHLELYPEHFGARWKGVDVRLTVRAYLMVEHLASLRGLDSSYRELYDVVRGEGFVTGDGELGLRSVVRTWIKRIRQSFRAVDAAFDQIDVRAAYGYHWRFDRFADA